MINWQPLKERHICGTCARGKVWIRLDQVGKVCSIYTIFGDTEKYLPTCETETTIAGAKLFAEWIVKNVEYSEKLSRANGLY